MDEAEPMNKERDDRFDDEKTQSLSHNRLVDRSNTRRHCNHRSSSTWNDDDDDDEKIEASPFL